MYKFYQHLLLSVLMLLSINTVFSQTTYYSQGTNQSPSVLSNWNTAANGSGSPATDFTADNGDTYIIQSGHSMVTTANWLPEGITLQIDAGASLTVVSNHAVRLLTGVSGLGGDGILVLGGSYIHNSSAAIHNSILGSNLNTYDAGSTIVIGSTQSFTRVVSCVNLTISSGISVTTTKNIQLDGILDLQSGSTLTMNAASSCNIVNLGSFAGQTGTGTLNTISTASSPIPPSSTWAGTINYNNSSTSQTIVSGDYTNLNGTGSSRTLGATIKISNTFTPGSGTYTSTGSTIEYNGTAAQNIAAFAYYNNLTISNSAVTVGASGNITVGGALTVNGGIILDMGTNAISGSLTTLGTGTIKTQKTTAALPSGRSWSQTVEYNAATGSQAIIDGTYANLTLSNSSGTQTASGTITVTSNLTVASGGTFDLGTNQLATVGGTIAGTGTIKTQKTASAIPTGKTWTQTVEYYAATGGQSIIVGTYPSLVLSNTSGTQSAAGNITVTNNLTIATGGTFDMVTYVLSGLAGTISGTGSLATQETSTTPLPSGKTWTGTVLYNSSSSQTIVQGTYIDLNASNGNRTLASSGNVNISGSFTAGSGTYTSTGSTVVFNATGSQNIPALTSSSYNNLTVSSTGTKSLTGDVTIAGTLTTSASTDFVAINGHTLTLQGSTSMSGSFKGSSTSNLTVSGSGGGSATIAFNAAATDSLMNTITLNRTGAGAGLTLGSDVAITNLLTITAGTFAVNGKIVTLKSTSITNTAQVGPVGGSITYGSSGSFTTERYIPNSPLNNRAYRDLAPMVNTNSNTYIFNTWQESGSSAAGLGTHITGVAGVSPGGVDATTGLDITGSGAASLYTFVNGTWTNVTNTKTTKPDVYQGYRILIRGDRTVNLYTTPTPTTMNAATTMRTNGEIITGSVTYSTLGVVNTGHPSTYSLNTNNTNGDFSIVANPYPCAINWNSIGKTNLLGTYWIYDPNIGTSGGYVTFDGATTAPGTSNANQYLQPGQAFFVQTTLPSPILLIQESDKAPGSTLTGVFRTTSTNKLGVNLSKFVTGRGNIVMDGSVVVFTPTDNNGVDANDAEKISNGTENIFGVHHQDQARLL